MASASADPESSMSRVLFSTFDVTQQVFYRSALSRGIVNLKPLLPGHVLVIPKRVTPRLADLNPDELTDLFLSVQRVGRVLEKAYDGQALTVAVQDGKHAGQSVPHVHVHLIPRRSTDFGGQNDHVYPALEESEAGLQGDMERASGRGRPQNTLASKSEDRQPRLEEEMRQEAEWLAGLFNETPPPQVTR